MGHHYVPRQHLRRFARKDEEACVWMYDKETRKFCAAAKCERRARKWVLRRRSRKSTGRRRRRSGHRLIDKLLKREKIDNAERTKLSMYFMIMLTRGPRQRKKSLERYPKAMAEIISETEADIRQWIADEPDNRMAHQRLQELEQLRPVLS